MKQKMLLPCMLVAASMSGAQNVGIGIVNPFRGKLEVQGTGVGSTVAIFGGDSHGISVQRGNPAIGFNQYFDGTNSRYIAAGFAAVQWLNASTGDMNFDMFGAGAANAVVSSSLRAMTISKTGNTGIGTIPLSYARVAVARGTGSYGTATFWGSSWVSHFNYSTAENTHIRGGKAGSYVYLNNIAGSEVLMGNPTATTSSLVRVGVNSLNPSFALEVKHANNRGFIMVNTPSYSNWHFRVIPALAPGSYQLLYYNESLNAVGSFHPQTGAYAQLSDERVKTDISPLPDIGALLTMLEPVQYQVDAPQAGPELHAGFIAQDIMKVFPGLVTRQQEPVPGQSVPDMHLLNYDGLAVYAIKLVQEQQQKIEELKKRVATIRKEKNLLP